MRESASFFRSRLSTSNATGGTGLTLFDACEVGPPRRAATAANPVPVRRAFTPKGRLATALDPGRSGYSCPADLEFAPSIVMPTYTARTQPQYIQNHEINPETRWPTSSISTPYDCGRHFVVVPAHLRPGRCTASGFPAGLCSRRHPRRDLPMIGTPNCAPSEPRSSAAVVSRRSTLPREGRTGSRHRPESHGD